MEVSDNAVPLYISNDLYLTLTKEEQDKFEWFARYKDDPKDDDWEDDNEIFTGVDDLMDFWGTEDCSNATGSVYKKLITEEEVEEWEEKGEAFTSVQEDEPDAPCNPVRIDPYF